MNPIDKVNQAEVNKLESERAEIKKELVQIDKNIKALAEAEAKAEELLQEEYKKYRHLMPEDFSIDGTIKYKISLNGDILHIEADYREEDTLVKLFGAMQYYQSIEKFSREKGKNQFSSEERSKVTITRNYLQKAVSNYGKIVYRKMISSLVADFKKSEQKPEEDKK